MSNESPGTTTTSTQSTSNLSNPRDVQGILALIVTIGLFAIIAFAMTKVGTLTDALAVVNVVAPLAALVLGFYFGKQAATGQ